MSDDTDKLPTIKEWLESTLGLQLPAISLPQTLKNADKALGKIVLAAGENVEAKIRGATQKSKAQRKIELEQMFRTADEKRKFENRLAATQLALEQINQNPGDSDAKSEIEDDWLNLFARMAEDKTSEELRQLFGKILAGEIRRPGSFSLRTLQLVSTLRRSDAEAVANFLPFAIDQMVVPFRKNKTQLPNAGTRLLMQELGVALGNPGQLGGISLGFAVPPNQRILKSASKIGVLIQNDSSNEVGLSIPGQTLTQAAKELINIANLPASDYSFVEEFGKAIATQCKQRQLDDYKSDKLLVHIVDLSPMLPDGTIQYRIRKTIRDQDLS
jgi:hypothetical protein